MDPTQRGGFQHQEPVRPSDQISEKAREEQGLHYAEAAGPVAATPEEGTANGQTSNADAWNQLGAGVGVPERQRRETEEERGLLSRLPAVPLIAGGAALAATALVVRRRRSLAR